MPKDISMSPSFIRRASSSNKGINQKQPTPAAFLMVLLITTCIALPIILVLGLYSLIALSLLLLVTLNASVEQREKGSKMLKQTPPALPAPRAAQAINEPSQAFNIGPSHQIDEENHASKAVTKPTKK